MTDIVLRAEATSLILNGEPFVDFVDGDTVVMTPVNPLTEQLRSSRSLNVQGRSDSNVYDLVFRVPKYGDSDIYMQTQINLDVPTVFAGSLKESYVRDGNDVTTTWSLSGATVTTLPTDTRNNQTGNNMMEYTLRVNQAKRV